MIEVEVLKNGDIKVPDHSHCLRCGRVLKDKKSRVLGYGPLCYEKMQKSKQKKLFDLR